MRILENKVAIITGAIGGLGKAHTKAMLEAGAKVVLTDILEEEGKAFAEKLGEDTIFVKHDVSNEKDWKNVISEAEKKFGQVDILINNAGILIQNKLLDESVEEFQKTMNINVIGNFLGIKHGAESMKKNNKGSIVNISSYSGIRGAISQGAYGASKFAVRGLTKTAALELAEYGIRVNSVHPGAVNTPILKESDPEELEKYLQGIPLKKAAEPEEVSDLIVFLASDKSSYSTGSEFIADGGVSSI